MTLAIFISLPTLSLPFPTLPFPPLTCRGQEASWGGSIHWTACGGGGWHAPTPASRGPAQKSMGDNLANPKMKRDSTAVKNITAGWEAKVWLITLRKQQLWEYKRLQVKAEALVTHLMVQSKHKKWADTLTSPMYTAEPILKQHSYLHLVCMCTH